MRATVMRRWDPWRELDQIQQEVNRLFSDRARTVFGRRTEFPPVNLWQTEDSLVLTAEVPGVSPDDLDITVTAGSVTLRGRRPAEEFGEDATWYRRERWADVFARTVDLPFEIDTQHTEATYRNGILTLRLQRPEEQKPKRVAVRTG